MSYITKCIKVQWNLMAELCTRLKIVSRYTKTRTLEDPQKKTERHSKLRSSVAK